jgi:Zn-dependent peptidase ImmA (M78 family)
LYPLKNKGEDLSPMRALRYGTGREEWEANWFSVALVMPSDLFRRPFGEHAGDLSAVAGAFSVSIAAAKVRATALGLF